MKKYTQNLIPILFLFLLFTVWEILVRLFSIPLYVLPTPSQVCITLFTERAVLLEHAVITLWEAVCGMMISFLLSLALGILMDCFPLLRRGIYPILVITQTIPMIVLAPIFIIYFGFGMMPKILTVILMCFFPIAVSFSDGLNQVNEDYVHLVRSYGAGRLAAYRLVKIPAAIPSLLSGLKVAATYSISGAVVGEWIGSQAGLGYYLLRVKNSYMLDKVFACVVVIILLSLFMNSLITLWQTLFLPYLKKNGKKHTLFAASILLSVLLSGCSPASSERPESDSDLQDITVILDYVANTNHTGMYVALEEGYYKEAGLNVQIIEPTEGATATLVAVGKGDFGISYQEDVTIARTADEPLPIKAIAAIIQHNTSGFASHIDRNILSPKNFEGKTYAGWGGPGEEAVLKAVMSKQGADFSTLNYIISDGSGVEALQDRVDLLWTFEGWDNIKCQLADIPIQYLPVSELDPRLDYYTPVIIANTNTLTNRPETVRSFLAATSKGYEYAIAHPEESAEILHTYAPDDSIELLTRSQTYLSEQYARDAKRWGEMKDEVWDNYTDFMTEYGVISASIPAADCYTNEFLPD